MAKLTIEERIADLEKRLSQEKEKKQKQDALKKAAEAKRKRANETRMKILIGSLVLGKVEKGEWPREKFLAMLDTGLARTDDRALFGLGEPGTYQIKDVKETQKAAQ